MLLCKHMAFFLAWTRAEVCNRSEPEESGMIPCEEFGRGWLHHRYSRFTVIFEIKQKEGDPGIVGGLPRGSFPRKKIKNPGGVGRITEFTEYRGLQQKAWRQKQLKLVGHERHARPNPLGRVLVPHSKFHISTRSMPDINSGSSVSLVHRVLQFCCAKCHDRSIWAAIFLEHAGWFWIGFGLKWFFSSQVRSLFGMFLSLGFVMANTKICLFFVLVADANGTLLCKVFCHSAIMAAEHDHQKLIENRKRTDTWKCVEPNQGCTWVRVVGILKPNFATHGFWFVCFVCAVFIYLAWSQDFNESPKQTFFPSFGPKRTSMLGWWKSLPFQYAKVTRPAGSESFSKTSFWKWTRMAMRRSQSLSLNIYLLMRTIVSLHSQSFEPQTCCQIVQVLVLELFWWKWGLKWLQLDKRSRFFCDDNFRTWKHSLKQLKSMLWMPGPFSFLDYVHCMTGMFFKTILSFLVGLLPRKVWM